MMFRSQELFGRWNMMRTRRLYAKLCICWETFSLISGWAHISLRLGILGSLFPDTVFFTNATHRSGMYQIYSPLQGSLWFLFGVVFPCWERTCSLLGKASGEEQLLSLRGLCASLGKVRLINTWCVCVDGRGQPLALFVRKYLLWFLRLCLPLGSAAPGLGCTGLSVSPRSPSLSSFWVLELQAQASVPSFLRGLWELNSRVRVCAASTLAIGLYP